MTSVPARDTLASLLLAAALLDLACARKEVARSPEPEVLTTPVVQKDVPLVREWIGTISRDDNDKAAFHDTLRNRTTAHDALRFHPAPPRAPSLLGFRGNRGMTRPR